VAKNRRKKADNDERHEYKTFVRWFSTIQKIYIDKSVQVFSPEEYFHVRWDY
jgi:hypothetical protein